MSRNDWKDWYSNSVREWKEEYRKQLKDWKVQFKGWKHKVKKGLGEGSVPPMPPIPHGFPLPPTPQIHFTGARSNVIASRIGDKEIKTVDLLIEAGLFETRSEAVAYMVSEGIKAQKDVMSKVTSALEEIRKLRRETDDQIASLRKEISITEETKTEEVESKGKFCTKCGKSLKELPKDISVCPYCGSKLSESI